MPEYNDHIHVQNMFSVVAASKHIQTGQLYAWKVLFSMQLETKRALSLVLLLHVRYPISLL